MKTSFLSHFSHRRSLIYIAESDLDSEEHGG